MFEILSFPGLIFEFKVTCLTLHFNIFELIFLRISNTLHLEKSNALILKPCENNVLYNFSVVFYFKLQSLLCVLFSYLLPSLKNSQTNNIWNVINWWIMFLYKESPSLHKISATQRLSLFLMRPIQPTNTRLKVLSVNSKECCLWVSMKTPARHGGAVILH